jgi:hypothetical protein
VNNRGLEIVQKADACNSNSFRFALMLRIHFESVLNIVFISLVKMPIIAAISFVVFILSVTEKEEEGLEKNQ